MPRWSVLIAIALGGALGALLRFGIGRWLQSQATGGFPWGTFAANALGCLAIGFCYVWLARASPEWRSGISIGLIGAMTTFSTYCLETLNLLDDRQYALAAANLLGSVVVGLTAAAGGMMLGRAVFES